MNCLSSYFSIKKRTISYFDSFFNFNTHDLHEMYIMNKKNIFELSSQKLLLIKKMNEFLFIPSAHIFLENESAFLLVFNPRDYTIKFEFFIGINKVYEFKVKNMCIKLLKWSIDNSYSLTNDISVKFNGLDLFIKEISI